MTCHFSPSRRTFLKHGGVAIGVGAAQMTGMDIANGHSLHGKKTLANNPLGFNGQRQDPVTGMYPLGQGYRQYSPRLMRFNAYDSLSPFGKGGLNGYAYCLGDPINQQDPSGHFGLLSLLIGVTVGAIVGAGVSAAAEGIQTAVTGDEYDWKRVGINAALGAISGGLGVIAEGAGTSVKIGLAVADSVASASADFGLEVATGTPVKEAAISAGIGAFIGLAAFGAGIGVEKMRSSKVGELHSWSKSVFKTELAEGGGISWTGYTDNFKGKNEDALFIHADQSGLLYEGLSSKGFTPREYIETLKNERGIDLVSSTKPLHVISCYGKSNGVGLEMSRALPERKVAVYSKRKVFAGERNEIWINTYNSIESSKLTIYSEKSFFDFREKNSFGMREAKARWYLNGRII